MRSGELRSGQWSTCPRSAALSTENAARGWRSRRPSRLRVRRAHRRTRAAGLVPSAARCSSPQGSKSRTRPQTCMWACVLCMRACVYVCVIVAYVCVCACMRARGARACVCVHGAFHLCVCMRVLVSTDRVEHQPSTGVEIRTLRPRRCVTLTIVPRASSSTAGESSSGLALT